MVHEHGVAVGLGPRDLAGGDRAARALDVLDDDLAPSDLAIGSAIMRVTVSVGPPALKGTTNVMFWSG